MADAADAPAENVASDLMLVTSRADPWVVDRLACAAVIALSPSSAGASGPPAAAAVLAVAHPHGTHTAAGALPTGSSHGRPARPRYIVSEPGVGYRLRA